MLEVSSVFFGFNARIFNDNFCSYFHVRLKTNQHKNLKQQKS